MQKKENKPIKRKFNRGRSYQSPVLSKQNEICTTNDTKKKKEIILFFRTFNLLFFLGEGKISLRANKRAMKINRFINKNVNYASLNFF